MICSEVDKLLAGRRADGAGLPAMAGKHVKDCPHCQELIRALTILTEAEVPSQVLLGRIGQGIAADLRPVRPLLPTRYLLVILIATFAVVAAAGVCRLRALAIPAMSPLQSIVMPGVLAAGAGLLAYSLVQQLSPGHRHRIHPWHLTIGILLCLAITAMTLFHFRHERHFWANGLACISIGLQYAITAAVLFQLVLRRGVILSPLRTGAANGLLAGLAGSSVLAVHCPNLHAGHVLTAHVGVAVLCTGAGLVAGMIRERRWVR